jgi:hypothetical protein
MAQRSKNTTNNITVNYTEYNCWLTDPLDYCKKSKQIQRHSPHNADTFLRLKTKIFYISYFAMKFYNDLC